MTYFIILIDNYINGLIIYSKISTKNNGSLGEYGLLELQAGN
jgi:hypothetical protein